MKVLLINGSPHAEGSTCRALRECAAAIESEGVQTELLHLGNQPIRGCQACPKCGKRENNRCRFDDVVNVALDKLEQSDAMIVGTPVHFASASGAVTSFMDRIFYMQKGLAGKPGAAITVARRGGNTGAFDQLSRYFPYAGMPLVPSCYWNLVFGAKAEDVEQDGEGLQIMRTLGRNTVWMLRCIQAGREAGIEYPAPEARVATNFIR